MFKHFLNFKDLPDIGKVQISEPFGFDGQTHKLSQDDGRYGRDMIIGNEKIMLSFFRDTFEFISPKKVFTSSVVYSHATHGFDILYSILKTKGWEGNVEYIIEKDGASFTTGIIDFFTAIFTKDEIKFSIIQNTKAELIKRKESIYINAFSDKDLEGNTISPCVTSNILLKSKSVTTSSKWKTPSTLGFAVVADKFHYFNPAQQIEKYEINNTLDWLDTLTANNYNGYNDLDANNYGIIYAFNDTSNVKVDITNLDYRFLFPAGANQRRVTQAFILSWGFDAISPLGKHHFFTVDYNEFTPPTDYFNTNDYSYTIPFVPAGAKVFLYFFIGVDTAYSDQDVLVPSMNIKVTATETGIDSVIKGVRLIDLLKHNVQSISGLNAVSPMYDIGGEHYDNFAFNGYLISQFLDKPFNNTFSDLMNIPKEINGDYQINTNKVEILSYSDFYRNEEIAVFTEVENEENTEDFNKRYFLKELNYKYNKSSFENANNEDNTLDDVHTEAQFMLPSKKADGVFNIEIKHVRSAFVIEKQRKRFIFEKKTSENDDTLFLLDVIPTEPITIKEINRNLKYFEGKIYSDGTFNWLLLGIEVGDIIKVNESDVSIISIDQLIISTSGSFGVGSSILKIEYSLTNVPYTSRGSEDFSFIYGILNPQNYSNLKYHIKRNLLNFNNYLATTSKYNPNEKIKNTMFRVNDKLQTQLSTEAFTVVDKADIEVNDISNKKILEPKISNVTVFCDFEKATKFFQDIQTKKGYASVLTIDGKLIKGYPIDAEYEWTTNKLKLKLEQRFEGDYLTIDKVGGIIFLKDIGKPIKLDLTSFILNNYFVSLYDSKNILLAEPIDYRTVKINNILYTDSVGFSNALLNILP